MIKKLWFCFFLTTSIAAGSPNLVVFDLDDARIISTRVEIRVIQKFEGYALAVVDDDALDSLNQTVDNIIVVDGDYSAGSYWLEHRQWGLKDFNKAVVDVVFQTEYFRVFKALPDEVENLRRKGLIITAISDTSLPLKPHVKHPLIDPPARTMINDLDSLVELVSTDSLKSYTKHLQYLQTKYNLADSDRVIIRWLENKFYDFGYDEVEIQSVDTSLCPAVNIICTKAGIIYPEKQIIIGSCYNSSNGYENNNSGGADNGAGIAVTLELARISANYPLQKTVKFVCFYNEDQSLYGSYYYVVNTCNNGDDIVLMINNDMAGSVNDNYLDLNIFSNEEASAYGDLLGSIARIYTSLFPIRHYNVFGGSEHYFFQQFGCPVIDLKKRDYSLHNNSSWNSLEGSNFDYINYVTIVNLGALYTINHIPGAIRELTAVNRGDGSSILLSWDSSPDPELAYYNVYIGDHVSDIRLKFSATSTQALIDSLNEGKLYYFGVTAVNVDGYEGFIGDIIEAVPMAVPHRPDTLIVSPLFGAIRIEWYSARDLDFDHYNLYRGEGENHDYALYARLESDNFFIDEDVNSGVKYYYRVSAMDTTGLESDPSNADYSFPVTFDMGILLVDENGCDGYQGFPDDVQQDSFYQAISANYIVEFYDYNENNSLRLNDIGPYSTIAWFDEDVISQSLYDNQEVLARYLDFGGNLLFIGWRAFNPFSEYPVTFREADIPYQYFGIRNVSATDTVDFVGALDAGQWPDIIPDSSRVLSIWNDALPFVEVIEPVDESEVIYHYSSLNGDTLVDNKACGLVHQGDNYNVVYLTFPLYHAGEGTGTQVFKQVMELFGEQTVFIGGLAEKPVIERISLGQNFPNPFNRATNISYRINQACQVNLSVYNILGQKLFELYDGFQQPGRYSVSFNSEELPSGVYFYRLSDSESSFTRRMIILH